MNFVLLNRVRYTRNKQRLHRVVLDVGLHLRARRRSRFHARGIQNIAQERRVARRIQEQADSAQDKMDAAADRIAVTQWLVPAEFPAVAILPSPPRHRLDSLRRYSALAADFPQRLR